MLCVGLVEPRKAQTQLVRAFSHIAERHPDAVLACIGTNHDERDSSQVALRAAVQAWDRCGQVRLIAATRDVARWYAAADLLVCASDLESQPRTVLEAMVWEVPVLATRVFGLPEVVFEGVTGWLCPPRDTSALADALDRALASTVDERRRIAAAARELVEQRHALVPYGAAMAQIIERCMNRSQGPRVLSIDDEPIAKVSRSATNTAVASAAMARP